MSILALPESPAQTPPLDADRLLLLARECGAAVATRQALDEPLAPAVERFARLVRHPALAGASALRRDLIGSFADAYLETKAHRRALLAAVIEEDDRQAVADFAARGVGAVSAERVIMVTTLYGRDNQVGMVQIADGAKDYLVQLSADDAKALAMNILHASEAARAETALGLLCARMELPDLLPALIGEFRRARDGAS